MRAADVNLITKAVSVQVLFMNLFAVLFLPFVSPTGSAM